MHERFKNYSIMNPRPPQHACTCTLGVIRGTRTISRPISSYICSSRFAPILFLLRGGREGASLLYNLQDLPSFRVAPISLSDGAVHASSNTDSCTCVRVPECVKFRE